MESANVFIIIWTDKERGEKGNFINSEDDVILLLGVMKTTQGWSTSVSEEWVEGLKKSGDISSKVYGYVICI